MRPLPTHDSLSARAARMLRPGYGWCGRCGHPWGWGDVEHTTDYRAGYGCSPLCETCWRRLDVAERIPYYRRLVSDVWKAPDDWVDVLRAVVSGR